MAAGDRRRTHYEVLGVAADADLEQVRAAYRAAARDHHPDAGGSPDRMRELNAAWQVLGDPAQRAAYDRELAAQGDHGTAGVEAGGAGPGFDVFEEDPDGFVPGVDRRLSPDEVADLLDGQPVRRTVAVEGWWAIMPPGLLVASILLFGGSFIFTSRDMLALSGIGFVVALMLFAFAPIHAMRRRPHDR